MVYQVSKLCAAEDAASDNVSCAAWQKAALEDYRQCRSTSHGGEAVGPHETRFAPNECRLGFNDGARRNMSSLLPLRSKT